MPRLRSAPTTVFLLMLTAASFGRGFLAPRFVRRLPPPSTAASATRLMATTGRSRGEDFQSVISEVLSVIRNTGPRPGVMRTLQVAGAVNKLVREFARNPKSFQENGRLYPARVLKRLFEELGATYIKLGQFIASSPTLFPKEYVLEFQSCLDNTPKIPYATIRKIIQDDLGRPITTVYAYVDPVPLASASVAQVHRAQLRNGTEVVIKVRKPGVDATLEADLGFLLISSKIIEFLNPSLSRLSFSNIVGDLRDSMLDELDFTKEAQNLINFRAFLDRNYIVDATAPQPYLEASSKRVLTMEYLKGVPLVDLEGIKRFTANPEQTLITALKTWALSVAANDVFHADVHGGNLLVLEDGRIGFLDFGIVSKISERVWKAVSDLVQAFVTTDYVGVADALVRRCFLVFVFSLCFPHSRLPPFHIPGAHGGNDGDGRQGQVRARARGRDYKNHYDAAGSDHHLGPGRGRAIGAAHR